MKKRLRFFEFSDLLQATLLRVLNKNDKDCIRLTVYGYTKELNHVEFSLEYEFEEEFLRDETFNDITKEMLFSDIKKMIDNTPLPFIID